MKSVSGSTLFLALGGESAPVLCRADALRSNTLPWENSQPPGLQKLVRRKSQPTGQPAGQWQSDYVNIHVPMLVGMYERRLEAGEVATPPPVAVYP
jgi:hypothetical protein